MRRLLLMACDIVAESAHPFTTAPKVAGSEDDVAKLTRQLFDAIAKTADHRSLHQAVKQSNDRQAPIRRTRREHVDNASDELPALNQQWRDGDIRTVTSGLSGYHDRRKRLCPHIVARLAADLPLLHY